MKKLRELNLKGARLMTDAEMKMVIGGKPEIPPPDELAKEAACKDSLPWDKCEMSWSGGTVTGQCILSGGKMYCRAN